MEAKSNYIMGYKKATKTEKKCNSCGFATFSLHVLYQHKYNCQGDLLGVPLKCGYCKRRYVFPFLLKQHQLTCIKRNRKKKTPLSLFNRKKEAINVVEKKYVNKSSTIVCPICMKFFTSRELYNIHEKNGCCETKKESNKVPFNARKSFSKVSTAHKRKMDMDSSDSDSSEMSNEFLSDIIDRQRNSFNSKSRKYVCIHCKNSYPAKVILMKHLELNYRCAIAYFEKDYSPRTSHQARKTLQNVVARKSFSYSKNKIKSHQSSKKVFDFFEGSARKSLPNASHRQSFQSQPMPAGTTKPLNQCPVCYDKFSDSFNFFQHQKKFNHWGKATKSMNASCKCPFCQKEFFSVRARNAHVQNHADKSDYLIKSFLKKTTCEICSQIFVTETVKQQHIKVDHSKRPDFSSKILNSSSTAVNLSSLNKLENENSKYVSLPLAMKESLKQHPYTCPVCTKEFVSTSLRNKHFTESHLDSHLECKFCPIKCSSAQNLDNHMKQFHYDSFKFECPSCKTKFPTAYQMLVHVKKIHPNLNSKNNLQSKVEPTNLQELRTAETERSQETNPGYFCDICNLNFQKLQFLRRHEQSKQHRDTLVKNLDEVHKSLSNLPPSPSPLLKQTPTPDNISCSECFEEFTSLKDFVPHRLSHFGEQGKYMEINEDNKYTCEICGDTSDSHSKVQLHLFWHLQVELNTKDKTGSADAVKKDPPIHVKSSNHVAKKSFGKPTHEPHQEVVIGGVKKHLFTCEACHIGFTNETHYNLHVRRFCKMKNVSPKHIEPPNLKDVHNAMNEELVENSALASSADEPEKVESVAEVVPVEFCDLCHCIFHSSIKQIHEEFCSKCKHTDLELTNNIDILKEEIKVQKALAACIQCSSSFSTSEDFSQHMISNHSLTENHETPVNEETEVEGESVIHCLTCNFIFFSTDILEEHEKNCKFSYGNSKLENFTPDFKAVLEENGIIGSCITCDIAFNNMQELVEHIKVHQEDPDAAHEAPNDEQMDTSESSAIPNEQASAVSENGAVPDAELERKVVQFNGESTVADVDPATLTEHNEVQIIGDAEVSIPLQNDSIEALRKNFSRLLSILVSDPDLLQQLGYGELNVDEVLVNVLQIMEQTPILKDESISDIDCLRKNIQILLNICLEDQVMSLITDGKTSTDDLVVEALKIFGGESSMSIIAME